jgi:squalene synthase HpnC
MTRVYEPGKKTHTDENFPVASYLIGKEYRGPVLAFYRFARAADDVADHPELSEAQKISQLDQFEATLLGKNDDIAAALPLRSELASRNLSSRHALDLLIAFRQDASKHRYKDWDDLMHYCMYSAAPVGRFVLDVHGESDTTWPVSDALCSALQIINHLQDCKADYLRLNRIYLPQDAMARHKVTEDALGMAHASLVLRRCLDELVHRTELLLTKPLSVQVRNKRLRLEVDVIERLAEKLLMLLLARDPLGERVHLHKIQMLMTVLAAIFVKD